MRTETFSGYSQKDKHWLRTHNADARELNGDQTVVNSGTSPACQHPRHGAGTRDNELPVFFVIQFWFKVAVIWVAVKTTA